ncbi:hypothetical protein L0244_18265 [bacterium]|nr:hypothetical protein [bacterium]
MAETKHTVVKFGRILSSFSVIGMLLAIAFLSMIILVLASRIESLAPAEFRMILDVLKNRFIR